MCEILLKKKVGTSDEIHIIEFLCGFRQSGITVL